MDQVQTFLNDPAIFGIWSILAVAFIDFLMGVIDSFRQGVFDLKKLPQVFDSVVLRKVLPVAAIGVAAFLITEPTQKGILLTTYGVSCLAVLSGLVKSLIEKFGVTGTYRATNTEMDRNMIARSVR